MNCIGDQVVLYRGRGYSKRFIPCRGVLHHTRSHHLPPFTRHVLGNLQAEAQRGCRTRPTQTLKSLVQVYRLFGFHPQGVRPRFPLTAPNDVNRVPRHQTGARLTRPRAYRNTAHPDGQHRVRPPAYYKHQKLRCNSWTEDKCDQEAERVHWFRAQCMVVTVSWITNTELSS